jgi:HEAT repeat protein
MSALAFLSRNEDDKTAVRKFLAARVNHPKSIIQTAAIKALGDLGDAKAVALLASFQSDDESDAIGKAAKEAIKKLQADKKPAISLGALRSEVSELQKQLRKLNEQMADMGKKVKAATTPAATPEKK